MKLRDETAIVTGSSKGIGRAIALAFAREGGKVAINYSKSKIEADEVAKEVRSLGSESIVVKADVSSKVEVKTMVDSVIEEFGKIDILVNNAGIGASSPLEMVKEEDWDRVLSVNLKGTFLCSQLVGKEMIKRKKGNIINIASIAGQEFVYSGSYGPSKAAVLNFTKQLAIEWSKYKVRVNAVSPGLIRTPMTERQYANEEILKKRLQVIPLGRIGRPEDIAKAVLFLASENSSYITGAEILVDGGLTASLSSHIPRIIKKHR